MRYLLSLPHLKVKKWHLRVEFFGRVEGIKRSARFRDLHHLLTRVQRYVDTQKANGTVALVYSYRLVLRITRI